MDEMVQSSWDGALTRLSQGLVPSEEALGIARTVANKLFRVIQANRKYRIDREMVMGSVGKKTALKIDYDFDCDIFIDDVLPRDFKKVKEVLADAIELSGLKAEHIRDSKVALQVTIDGLDFDIVPAINFRGTSSNVELQRQRALEHIRALDNPVKDGYKYGSSLSEWQVEFIKRQSGFTHDVIRLAKYWNKTVFLREFIQGRSSLIECIATDAANREEDNFRGRESILRAFRRFLDSIARCSDLNIVFEMFYSRRDVDPSIACQRPLVMDPSNPYRNYAYDLVKDPHLASTLQNFARTTIQRLESEYSNRPANLQALFQVQPSVAPHDLPSYGLPTMSSLSYLVGVGNGNQKTYPNMIVRNEAKFKGKGLVVRILQNYLWSNIEIVQGSNLSADQLKKKVKYIIDYQICESPIRWTSTNAKHEDYDLTFEVPCGELLIKLSINWPF